MHILFIGLVLWFVKEVSAFHQIAFYDRDFHLSDKHANLAPTSIQRFIFRHQNPVDCAKSKFWRGFNKSGLGGELFTIASQLSHAINHETVLVWGQSKYYSTSERGFGCIFQKLSHCEANLTVKDMPRQMMELFVIPHSVEGFMLKYMPKISHAWKAQNLNNESLSTITRLQNSKLTHELFGSAKSKKTLLFFQFEVFIANVDFKY